jgi:hypothetical protein
VDIHCPGKVGRELIIEPIIVGEPPLSRDRDQIACAGMVDAEELSATPRTRSTSSCFSGKSRTRFPASGRSDNVRDLMVRYGKHFAGAAVRVQPKFPLTASQPSLRNNRFKWIGGSPADSIFEA